MGDVAVAIRTAGEEDVEGIVELWTEFIDFHGARDPHYARTPDAHARFAEFVRESLAAESFHIVVAGATEREHAGRLVGYGIGEIKKNPPVFKLERYGYIMDLAVTAAWRRRGVGERLHESLLAWFRAEGLTRAELTVAATNEVSRAFWQQQGYAEQTRRLVKDI